MDGVPTSPANEQLIGWVEWVSAPEDGSCFGCTGCTEEGDGAGWLPSAPEAEVGPVSAGEPIIAKDVAEIVPAEESARKTCSFRPL